VAETQETAGKAKTEVETVTMSDGRAVDFAGKKKLIKESLQTPDGKIAVRMDFRNGQTRLFPIPDALLAKFAAHGAEQKLGDEIAGLNDLDDAVLAVDELMERLGRGEWNVAREGNGLAGTSVLARALAEVQGVDIEKVKTFLKTKSQAEKIALRNNPRVKPVVERIEAEKANKGSKVDTDAMLGELSA
jgi:hypothetical protein